MRDKQKQKIAQKRHYQDNKENYRINNHKRRRERKEWFRNFLSTQKCLVCDENCNAVLDLHHLDPNQKDDNVSHLLAEMRSYNRVAAEIKKCVVLCSNCHRKHHANLLDRVFTEADLVKEVPSIWSAMQDSNLRSPDPKSGAMARLR